MEGCTHLPSGCTSDAIRGSLAMAGDTPVSSHGALTPAPPAQSPAQIFHLLMAKQKMESREEGIKRTK